MRNDKQLVVECYAPWKVRLAWALALGLGLALAWSQWIYAPQRMERQATLQEAERLRLMEQLYRTRTQQQAVSDRMKELTRKLDVERQAKGEVQAMLRKQEQENFRLRRQLTFYQSIVDPPDKQAGLRLESFRVDPSVQPGTTGTDRPGGEIRRYRFRMVLIQTLRNERIVHGQVRIDLKGTRNGQPLTLTLTELSQPPMKSLALEFRYFQTLEGELLLPPGFTPNQVHIRVTVKHPHQGIDATLAWSEAS